MTGVSIKPCPFCGNANPSIDEVDIDVHAVCCDSCKMTGPIGGPNIRAQSPETAIALWNRRPGEGLPPGINEALNSGDGVYRP